MPAIKKYVDLRSRSGDACSAIALVAALVMPSPVVKRHACPSAVQCSVGNCGDAPGIVTFCARKSISSG
jgi:hypothetical protein